MKISHTRAMVTAILDGRLRDIATEPHSVFGIHVPISCPGVPADVLNPKNTWKDPAEYDKKAHDLWAQFQNNYKQLMENPNAIGVSGG